MLLCDTLKNMAAVHEICHRVVKLCIERVLGAMI